MFLVSNNSNGLLEMEYEPEAKSTSSIAQLLQLYLIEIGYKGRYHK
jgi:hypothetical protein